jgi:hypothetical protein
MFLFGFFPLSVSVVPVLPDFNLTAVGSSECGAFSWMAAVAGHRVHWSQLL